MNVLAEFFNGFVINGFYFLRQQCSNDAIVPGRKLDPSTERIEGRRQAADPIMR